MGEQRTSIISSTDLSRRVDVTKGKMFELVPGVVYFVRLGFFDPSGSARCVFVLEPQHTFTTDIFDSMKVWEEYYLTADVEHLHLDVDHITFTQMVVAVDKEQKKVSRGFFLGSRPSAGMGLLYVLDIGSVQEFPITSLFATTALVAETQFTGFPCVLDSLELFKGTKLLSSVMARVALEMNPSTICKVICKGFVKGEEKLPIIDFWRYVDPAVEPLITLDPDNMMLATFCANQWTRCARKAKHVFGGAVVKVRKDSRVFIHLHGEDGDDPPAVFMDAYLEKFQLADIQTKVPCLKKPQAEAGRLAKTIYVAEFSEDNFLYRCRIQKVFDRSVKVEFMDYGNTETVPYAKVFEAAAIDKVLAILPSLIWKGYLFTISKVLDENAALGLFVEEDLEFKICAGLRKGSPLVSITAKGEDGVRRNMFKKLREAGLIIPIGQE